jgi:hypothetical protein
MGETEKSEIMKSLFNFYLGILKKFKTVHSLPLALANGVKKKQTRALAKDVIYLAKAIY